MNRAGVYVNNLTGEATYQSFKPNPLPPMPEIEMDEGIVRLLVDANKQLVKLDTASQLISNADLFISMYVRKEALISSQIEGTQCTLDDVLDPEVETNANLDVSAVFTLPRADLTTDIVWQKRTPQFFAISYISLKSSAFSLTIVAVRERGT